MIAKTMRRTLGPALASGAMMLAAAPAMAQDAAAAIDAMIDAPAPPAGPLRVELVHQEYSLSSPFADRDGTRYELALEYRAAATRDHGWVVGAAFEDKTARTRTLGYLGWRLYAAARMPVNQGGTYTALSATVR